MPSTTRSATSFVAVIAFAGVALVACGGDDAEALTKAEFIEQADAVCETATAEIDAVFDGVWTEIEQLDENDRQGIAVQFDAGFDEAGPVFDRQVEGLRALAPPADDAEMIESMLDDLEAGIAEYRETIQAAANGDEDALDRMESDEDPLEDVNARARDYGLTTCGAES